MDTKIIDFIADNREQFQVNFGYVKPKARVITGTNERDRMINIRKYGANQVLVNFFYKRISRML